MTKKIDTSRPIYFAMDLTTNETNDKKIMNNIVSKLQAAGFTVKRTRWGPNELAQQYYYLYDNKIKNSIIFNLMNGVDPSNIREASQDPIEGFQYANRVLKPFNNQVVLGWFYGACDCVHEGGSCYKSVKASESSGRLYNPKQFMDTHGILCLCEKNDKTGDKVAEAFIELFTTEGDDDEAESTSTTSTEETTTTEEEETSTETVVTQQKVRYNKVITVKTDANGAYEAELPLAYAGEYTVNHYFAGDLNYSPSQTTVKLQKTKGTEWEDTTVLTETETNVTTTATPTTTTDTPTTKQDPFTTRVALRRDSSNNNIPNVSVMQTGTITYQIMDTTKTHTILRAQYQEVLDRDSKTMQIQNMVSEYVAVKTKDEPTTYHVLHRKKWNAIEETLMHYLVAENGKAHPNSVNWPEEIFVNFQNKTTTIEGKTYKFKSDSVTYHEVNDRQNTGFTCGPTSASACSQFFHHYQSEQKMQKLIKAVYGDGSSPSTIASKLREVGFNTTETSSFNTLFENIKKGNASIFHYPDHYVAGIGYDPKTDKILISNSGSTGGNGWQTTNTVKKWHRGGVGIAISLNWTITDEEKTKLENFNESMGGKWNRTENTNEGLTKVDTS